MEEGISNSHCDLDAPVLIVGAPRSGTSWVQRLLVSHPQICGGQESHFFEVFADAFNSARCTPPGERTIGLACYVSPEQLHDVLRSVWRRMMQPLADARSLARALVEKTPDHAHYLPMITTLFPRARFVHVIRDSRGVVASMLAASRATWGRGWAPRTSAAAAIKWYRSVRDARHDGLPLGPARYLEIFYEQLLADPHTQTQRLYDFVGVDAAPGVLEGIVEEQRFDRQKEIGGTPLAQIASPTKEPPGFFNSGKADSWKTSLTLWQKLTIWRYTRRLMKELGYPR